MLDKIKKLLESHNLSDEELKVVENILEELEDTGESSVLDYLYNIDYEEIPVDIDTFIESDMYLGKVYDNGKGIYPYWRAVLRDIFDGQNKYSEVIFSGAIGVGKSSIATVGLSYILYCLMCLRNPPKFYRLPESAHIGFALTNMSVDLAYTVGYRKLLDTLMLSPWFIRNGKIKGRPGTEKYVPGKGIDLIPGSRTRHYIGKDIFCLSENTEVLTDLGWKDILNVTENDKVLTLDEFGNKVWNNNHYGCVDIGDVDELYILELEDGTKLECSSDHKVLVGDTWIEVKDLRGDEDVKTL